MIVLQAVQVAAAPAGAEQSLRQVAGILDYIGGDYRVAVGDAGEILSEPEYREQLSLATDADALAAGAGLAADDPVRAGLGALTEALRARRPPREIATRCRDTRSLIAGLHRVTLAPKTPPRRAEGERLYRTSGCASCHGVDGSADTETARTLDPRPANFLDPERVAAVSPHRAFFALSFGVAGTAMTAYPQLSDAERWDLAFFVLSLRHSPEDVTRGRALFEAAGRPLDASAQALSALTDEEVLARVERVGVTVDRVHVLGYLRGAAPFDAPSEASAESFAVARARIEAALDAYRAGDREETRSLLVGAYLDGFEPHEAALAARDPALVRDVERAMLGLRESAARGAPIAEVEAEAARVRQLLARASQGRGNATTALVGALTITLREGLEAALLVAALLGIVRRQGLVHLARWVHAGWLLAIPAGVVTWLALGSVLGGLERELAEGIAALVAAVVLIGVTHWVIGQATAKRFMGLVADRIGRAGRGRAAAVGVLGLSFLAAYREAFEVVLFFQALLLDAEGAEEQVGLGIALGAAGLVVIALALRAVGRRLALRPFLLASSALLALLAVVLAGKGVRALQEAGVIGLAPVALPELPLLGVYATVAGLVTQGVVVLVIAASALAPLRARESAGST